MGAVAAVDALHKVVAARVIAVYDQIDAGAVQRDGVKAREDAHIVHAGVLGHGAAVAVNGKILHDGDIGNLARKVLCHGGGGVCHGFKEGVLLGAVLPQDVLIGDLAAGMDVRLAGAGRAADGQLLERTAVAAIG